MFGWEAASVSQPVSQSVSADIWTSGRTFTKHLFEMPSKITKSSPSRGTIARTQRCMMSGFVSRLVLDSISGQKRKEKGK